MAARISATSEGEPCRALGVGPQRKPKEENEPLKPGASLAR
jgi:hypothetical protein